MPVKYQVARPVSETRTGTPIILDKIDFQVFRVQFYPYLQPNLEGTLYAGISSALSGC